MSTARFSVFSKEIPRNLLLVYRFKTQGNPKRYLKIPYLYAAGLETAEGNGVKG